VFYGLEIIIYLFIQKCLLEKDNAIDGVNDWRGLVRQEDFEQRKTYCLNWRNPL